MPTTRNTWKSSSTRRSSNNNRNTSRGFGGTRSSTGSWSNSSNWSTNTTTRSYSPTQFSTARREIQAKIGSYRTLNEQFSGAGKVTAFSPNTCSKWISYVDSGCNVFKFTNNEFCRFFGTQMNNCPPSFAFRTLRNKCGTGIKAVTRGKNNCWLVAATPRVTARPFSTYTW